MGKLPLEVTADKHLISYWLRLLNKDKSTLAYIVYTIALKLFTKGEYKANWSCRGKCILDNCGLSYIWHHQQFIDGNPSKLIIHQQIENIAMQTWYAIRQCVLCIDSSKDS